MNDLDLFRRLYLYTFSCFLRFAFTECHPGVALLDAWYIDVIADFLTGCLERGTKRFILNLPPRYLKSFCASVCFPVWALARDPTLKIVIIAGNQGLSRDLRRRILTLVQSARFRALFPHLRFECKQRDLVLPQGGRITFGVVSRSMIGQGADIVIIDDPQTPSAAAEARARGKTNAWFDQDVLSRLNKGSGVLILVMQRLHHGDLTGYALDAKEGWTHLCLPAIALEDEQWRLASGLTHGRRKGEPLHPLMESREALWALAREMGACAFWAQCLQRPLPSEHSNEQRWGTFVYPLRPDQDPEVDVRESFMGSVPELRFLQYDVFGEGKPPPCELVGQLMSDELCERLVKLQQQQLMAKCAKDDQEHEARKRERAASGDLPDSFPASAGSAP